MSSINRQTQQPESEPTSLTNFDASLGMSGDGSASYMKIPIDDTDVDDEIESLFQKVTSHSMVVPEGASFGFTSRRRPAALKETSRLHKGRMLLIYFCFWLAPLGTFFVWFSMTGTIFYWAQIYEKDILLYMQAVYSSPAFPVQLMQAKWDFHINQKYGKMRAFRFRMVILLSVLMAISAAIPFLPRVLWLHLILCFFLGAASSASYGTLFQFVSLYSKTATSFLSLGYASPGVLLLVVSHFVFGSPPDPSQDNLIIFFGIVCGMVFLGLLSFFLLLWLSREQLRESTYIRIEQKRRRSTQLKGSINIQKPKKKAAAPNNFKILGYIWKSALGIGVLMISRLTVFTILPHVPAEHGDQLMLSQRLVYINLTGDLLGRFLTVVLPRLPEKKASLILLIIIIIHFSCLDGVLLYIYGDGILPPNDILSQVFLGIFATVTGFCQTQSYAYAGIGVPEVYKTQVGALLNVATQVGNCLGILISFTLQLAL